MPPRVHPHVYGMYTLHALQVRDLEAELRKVRRDGDTDIDYKKAMRDFVNKGRLEKYRISGRTFSSLLEPSPAFSCLL